MTERSMFADEVLAAVRGGSTALPPPLVVALGAEQTWLKEQSPTALRELVQRLTEAAGMVEQREDSPGTLLLMMALALEEENGPYIQLELEPFWTALAHRMVQWHDIAAPARSPAEARLAAADRVVEGCAEPDISGFGLWFHLQAQARGDEHHRNDPRRRRPWRYRITQRKGDYLLEDP